ncbi:DUF3139 domain-containing protein [Staphylococcus saccharolyticus]|uniref:DUF3139 domain-containing protein n=1 Tax=Staphylococcus saccharolyticus TaxID=33028 RepID=UPI00102DB906|nr:DUF3139 domain-containing protein [Staphylococcus saccharolyticus]MBL7573663.1 DUF3139 domain-containing protein [Staphylococcus saccharolyticus]MBL7584547.1 DUF3139 domain-containing protein [Staphylococcus saccharolyticus]MBL7639409.1 DUF3139 domain-containing protein [Staphylococcus saccharolyticus]QRJ68726.1 DUF3139 domain-containing protein [Staphylococcus saccharolyticus]TAA92043.1 hypothetical protein DMB74_08275 [Staphylococcus saccharolyticus]
MSRKQIIFRVIIILIISLILAIVFFFGLKTYQGHKNVDLIDSYINEHHLKDKIKKEETLYSSKKGLYYKEIVYKDEPNITYVVQPISTTKGIFSEGFDSETKKSKKKAKHSDFDKNYKPSK